MKLRRHGGGFTGFYAASPPPDPLENVLFKLIQPQAVGIGAAENPASRLEDGHSQRREIGIVAARAKGFLPASRKRRRVENDAMKCSPLLR